MMLPLISGNLFGLWMQKLLIIISVIASVLSAGCANYHLVHKIDVQQGNVITQDEVNLLEPGMTRRQVRFIMGSPMIADVFHQDRWDYVYVLWPGYGEPTGMRITLFFDGDLLVRYFRHATPGCRRQGGIVTTQAGNAGGTAGRTRPAGNPQQDVALADVPQNR